MVGTLLFPVAWPGDPNFTLLFSAAQPSLLIVFNWGFDGDRAGICKNRLRKGWFCKTQEVSWRCDDSCQVSPRCCGAFTGTRTYKKLDGRWEGSSCTYKEFRYIPRPVSVKPPSWIVSRFWTLISQIQSLLLFEEVQHRQSGQRHDAQHRRISQGDFNSGMCSKIHPHRCWR